MAAPTVPPQPPTSTPNFTDVNSNDYYATPVMWTVSKGITTGTTATTFSLGATYIRGQIATFLHRYFLEPLDTNAFIATVTKPVSSDPMKLALLPPKDYRKHADWYLSLTPAAEISDARLLAEYEVIENLIDDWRTHDLFITDSTYSRSLDLWAQARTHYIL